MFNFLQRAAKPAPTPASTSTGKSDDAGPDGSQAASAITDAAVAEIVDLAKPAGDGDAVTTPSASVANAKDARVSMAGTDGTDAKASTDGKSGKDKGLVVELLAEHKQPTPSPAPETPDAAEGVLGMAEARAALAAVRRSRPRDAIFIAAPRTKAHAAAVETLLADEVAALPPADAVVVVSNFAKAGGFTNLRLPAADADRLASAVARAVEMLSLTIPAAFESDSYRVARLALDEELRSGHDTALDSLKRRALAQNIGLLRTPLGYAVAPMHEGRVVAPDVFKSLPEALRAGVEAKLDAFEAELAGVLEDRTRLQQDFAVRLRNLDEDTAGLAVRAALAETFSAFGGRAEITAWLSALRTDLTANTALFAAAARRANGETRAPVEIDEDPALSRYRVEILSPPAGRPARVVPAGLDRASLCGALHPPAPGRRLTPVALQAGALSAAGAGLVCVDARDLQAEFTAWPLLRQALASGVYVPSDAGNPDRKAPAVAVPFDARLVVTGDIEDYRSLAAADRDAGARIALVRAFEPSVPRDAGNERAFAAIMAGILAHEHLPVLDKAATAALVEASTIGPEKAAGANGRRLSADIDAARDLAVRAGLLAKAAARTTINAADIAAAIAARADEERLRAPLAGAADTRFAAGSALA